MKGTQKSPNHTSFPTHWYISFSSGVFIVHANDSLTSSFVEGPRLHIHDTSSFS